MNKYSPTPWKFVRDRWSDDIGDIEHIEVPLDYSAGGYSYNPFIRDANGEAVVGCDEYNVFYATNQAANVALLLAAPDLLEALEEFVTTYIGNVRSGDWGNWDPEEEERVIKARAAIAKAKGEQA